MKIQKYKNYGLFVLMLLTLSNCENLQYDETSYNRKDDVFSEIDRSKSFLTGIYSYLPTDFNSVDGAMRSSASDESEYVLDTSNIQNFYNGSWSAIQPLDNVWSTMYSGIRAANMFLVESQGKTFPDKLYNNDYKEIIQQYNNYPYEARFLRAFFYFELIKRYKNVPLITTVLTPEEAITANQNTFAEVVAFIVSECDAIAPVLPATYSTFSAAKETGRTTKGAALALKARVLLYAASPLHNPSNDLVLWQNAANAAKAVINLNSYTLESSYNNVVNKWVSSELILDRRLAASNDFEKRNFPIGFEGGNTGTCPTQNLVDAYEMKTTGLPITNAASGYNPLNPYAGRDTRLSQTILFNGSIWKGLSVSTYIGGANGQPINRATKTGYYLKKYLVESINLLPNNTTTKDHAWVLFRYAEVLLNYAEAMNEAYGPENASALGMTALQAVNMVRIRAGMPPFPAGLSQTNFRTKLRNERQVELAFEDHRFWDIRRWKIGQQTENIYAMKITRDANFNYIYEKNVLEVRPFTERMYLYPIPQSEIYKNKNLTQNPGW